MEEQKYLKLGIGGLILLVVALAGFGIYINHASSSHIAKMVESKYAVLPATNAKYCRLHIVMEHVNITAKTLWTSDINAQNEGVVSEVRVKNGEHVQKGQVLAVLKNEGVEAQIAAASASIDEARAQLLNYEQVVNRNKALIASDAVSQQDYDSSIAQRDAAQARLNSVTAQYNARRAEGDKMVIMAPQDAEVAHVYCASGDYVRAGSSLVLLTDLRRLQVRTSFTREAIQKLLPLDQNFILEIKPYLLTYKVYPITGENTVNGLKLNQFPLTMSSIAPALESDSDYYELFWEAQNPAGIMEPTYYNDVRIISQRETDAFAVPLKSLRRDSSGASFVYTVDGDDRVHRQDVQTGGSDDTYIEITDGLTEGDTVLVGEDIECTENMKVRTKAYES